MNAIRMSRKEINALVWSLHDDGFPLEREKRLHFLEIADNDGKRWTGKTIDQRGKPETAQLIFACRMLLLDDCYHAIKTLRATGPRKGKR